MIFVTVGTHDQGFERLIKKMDEIAAEIDEEVVIQTGFTEYEPIHAEWFKFKDIEHIKEYYKKAKIIVAHAGAGTLLDSLSFGKTVIVVPRRKEHEEHIDDQQLELTEELEELNTIIAVYDIKNLNSVLRTAIINKKPLSDVNPSLSNYLKNYLRGSQS